MQASHEELLERMAGAYWATRAQSDDNSVLHQKLTRLAADAAQYASTDAPGGPPGSLLKRILRGLARRLLSFQIYFNREVAEALLELSSNDRAILRMAQQPEALLRVIDLEQEVAQLAAQVERLSAQVEVLRAMEVRHEDRG